MSKFLQVLFSALIGASSGLLLFSGALTLFMAIYIAKFGYFRIDLFFGSNKLESPVFWASVFGAFIGMGLGFLIGLFLSVFNFQSKANIILLSSVIPFAIFFLFYVISSIRGGESISVSANDSFEIIKLSLISVLPAIITGIIVSKFLSYYNLIR
jgi:hypothetical protein